MRAIAFLLAACLAAFAYSSHAAGTKSPQSLIQWIEASLAADAAFTQSERSAYLDAFRQRLAGYSGDILHEDRLAGAEVLMRIVAEGSFDEATIERTVAVASAAYIAVRRGAPAEAVEGIALYGFSREGLSAEVIATYALGYHDCVSLGVPAELAEDLVYRGLSAGWDEYTFRTYKWAHVEAAKDALPAEQFHAYLMAHAIDMKPGERPGALVSSALDVFRDAKRKGRQVEIPAYEGIYIPKGELEKEPAPFVPEKAPALEDKKVPVAPPVAPDKKGPVAPPVAPVVPEKKVPVAPGLWARIQSAYRNFLGAPYVWGGQTPRGTDCSGFVQSVYREAGVKLPRVSQEQWRQGREVQRSALKRGDLVFFKTMGSRVSHVGIVTAPDIGEFVHASSSNGVRHDQLSSRYYGARYAGARRIIPEGMAIRADALYALGLQMESSPSAASFTLISKVRNTGGPCCLYGNTER